MRKRCQPFSQSPEDLHAMGGPCARALLSKRSWSCDRVVVTPSAPNDSPLVHQQVGSVEPPPITRSFPGIGLAGISTGASLTITRAVLEANVWELGTDAPELGTDAKEALHGSGEGDRTRRRVPPSSCTKGAPHLLYEGCTPLLVRRVPPSA